MPGLGSCKRWLMDGWHCFAQCNLLWLNMLGKTLHSCCIILTKSRRKKEECCVGSSKKTLFFLSINRGMMSRNFIFKRKGRKARFDWNHNWLFVRDLCTELGVKFSIVSKTTNIRKDCEDCKGQRHRCRSNLRPSRPRFQMRPPGEEKWKRKWNGKKIIKCRKLETTAWWFVYAVKPILHCRPLCLSPNHNR